MLMGHTDGLPKLGSPRMGSPKELLLSDPVSEMDADEEGNVSEQILHMASFEEFASSSIMYDTIIWVSISLLLVLAWGVGVIMLLYLPMRRYVLQKEITSRKLYVTPDEVVYKVSRPSFIPFRGIVNIERHTPLSLVIDIIIEQGCLQSIFGIHTFRLESISQGKASPVDELQVQGVYNPEILRKVIVKEASRVIQDVGRNWKAPVPGSEVESTAHMRSFTDAQAASRSPSRSWKASVSPPHASMYQRGFIRADMLLNKIDEISKSVKKLEVLVEKSRSTHESHE